MDLLLTLLWTIVDSLIGHGYLLTYLFAILDERPGRKRLGRILPPLAASSLVNAVVILVSYLTIPDLLVLRSSLSSAAVLAMCTAWVRWAWRVNLRQAFAAVCMAGVFQVALSALLQAFYNLYSYLLGAAAALLTAELLWRLRFGRSFRLLLEEGEGLGRLCLLLFGLEASMEALSVLRWGVQTAYVPAYSILTVVLTVLMTALVLHLARQVESGRLLQAQQDVIAQQKLYERDLEAIEREVRSFRHDYKNLAAGLAGQVSAGESEALHRALASLDANFDRRLGEKVRSAAQIGNIRVPQVRSLLLTKLTDMEAQGVSCRLEVLYPVEAVGMDVWDFVRCLGVLLDNAAEAAKETAEPWVEIILLAQGGTLSLRVANAWSGAGDPGRFWEEGFSTKGPGRGLGLGGYQRILAGWPNAVSSAGWEDGTFCQELTISEVRP